ncbi:hypothetical protein EON82_08135 [bacterium]|nr:MAG: hypothetical protein EON82_08135 [bacterium]
MTPTEALRATEMIAAVGVFLCAAEAIRLPEVHDDRGLLSWAVTSTGFEGFPWPRFVRGLDRILSYRRFRILNATRVAALFPLFWLSGPAHAVFASVVTVVGVLLFVRSHYGQDGADQVLTLVFGTAALAEAVGTETARALAVGSLGVHACLAYFFAGITKWAGPGWRTGRSLTAIFSTQLYGSPFLHRRLAHRPRLARLVAHLGMAWEVGFPIMLVLPAPFAASILLMGIGFHLITAVFMGLNTFLWAFLALYPGAWYLHGLLRRLIEQS